MNNNHLTAEVVFDQSIVGSVNDSLSQLARILVDVAPTWVTSVTAWSPNPRERDQITDTGSLASLPQVVERRTRWATGDRHTGSVELRGSSKDLNVVISVNSSPLARVGGKLLMSNGITFTTLRKQAEGPQADWMRALFGEVCATMNPLWGAVYTKSEYWDKVMEREPSIRAVGRDFSQCLPGLFSVNYFGRKYVELIGSRKLECIESASASRAGRGWIVDVISDPFAWRGSESAARNESAMAEIGSEFFFLKGAVERATRAPDWRVDEEG